MRGEPDDDLQADVVGLVERLLNLVTDRCPGSRRQYDRVMDEQPRPPDARFGEVRSGEVALSTEHALCHI